MVPKAQKEFSWIRGQQKALGPTSTQIWGMLEFQKNSNIG